MISKKKLLKDSKLYLIIDKELAPHPLELLNKLKDKRIIDIVQLRDKISPKPDILRQAKHIKKLLKGSKVIFIINDYIDIAQIVDADGVHLGQQDLPIKIARRFLGNNKIIGISCHSLKEALEAEKSGADYISIGPIFHTSTKPKYKAIGKGALKKISQKIIIPFFAIGGIKLKNLNEIFSAGARRIAVCSLLCRSKNISFTMRRLNLVFK